MDEMRNLANSGQQKQIFRWEDQEIYYFSMALKEYGKDYNMISRIIQTKQVTFFKVLCFNTVFLKKVSKTKIGLLFFRVIYM